ncbi:MAG: thiamine diphosphokinase [Deltaproteobacteria bacterium]|nr:thiamine diphosphokinase [Deltaproteobacteria bacterium]
MRQRNPNSFALVALDGVFKSRAHIKKVAQQATLIVAADGAYNKLKKIGIKPHVVVGDFDTLGFIPIDCKVQKYSRKKNKTDGELAIEYALSKKVKKIVIAGFYGGREDHMLGHYALLQKFSTQCQFEVLGKLSHLHTVSKSEFEIRARPGSTISIVCLDSQGAVVSTQGLKYEASKLKLFPGGRGLSNEIVGKFAIITVHKGIVFVLF